MIEKSYGNKKIKINCLLDETMSTRVCGAKSLKYLTVLLCYRIYNFKK